MSYLPAVVAAIRETVLYSFFMSFNATFVNTLDSSNESAFFTPFNATLVVPYYTPLLSTLFSSFKATF